MSGFFYVYILDVENEPEEEQAAPQGELKLTKEFGIISGRRSRRKLYPKR